MIAITVSYLISLSVFMGSMRAGVATTVNDVMGCDIRIFIANAPRDFRDELKDEDGIEEVMGVTHGNARIWDDDEWVGHGLLEEDYDESVSVHVLDTDIVSRQMKVVEIIEPEEITLKEMMDDLHDKDKVIITSTEADEFDLDVGDDILVDFSVGITYASLDDLFARNEDTAIEVSVQRELEVVAIVDKLQGFATGAIVGQDEGFYNIFVSWKTFEDVARYNLPGGNTDLIFRNKTRSGIPEIDNAFTNWFNFSDISSILDDISGIEYYTTRMEYFSPTFANDTIFNPFDPKINFESSVVGIRTNSSGDFVSDSFFGQNQLINKSSAYNGTTMEELLNNTTGVCVVDETYVANMQNYDPSFGINSSIAIFPQELQENLWDIFPNSAYTNALALNGTITSGSVNNLTLPYFIDKANMTIDSNKTTLEWIIDFDMTFFMTHYISPFNISLISSINNTVNQLELQVFNHYTQDYDKLGDINKTINQDFNFNQQLPPFSYINQSNFVLRLRILGQNSTYDSDYRLTLDQLYLKMLNSTTPLIPQPYWPTFKVIGIIKDPLLYQTERLNWLAGFEVGYDIAETENSVYINYEDARYLVYKDYRGNAVNGSEDLITHIYIHCSTVDDIEKTKQELQGDLGSTFTIIDLKTPTLEQRTYAFDWYIWIEEGFDDEEVLEELIEFIEDEGYVVLFGFTGSFITAIFQSMIDLISLIMNGILIFAIIIAMIGLALHCLLTTMARRREIGMLRSIGLNKKGVVRTISGETLVVSLLGALIGIIAGIITGVLMVSAVPSTGFLTVTLTIPWLTIAILVGVTLLTAIVSSRYPSKWAANIVIIDAVRTR
jgi:ABC-type antimicrobial peptide transport system permease subunit